MAVNIISKSVPGFTGNAWLVKYGSKYYIVSHTEAYGLNETLVFECDYNSKIISWSEVAGGKLMSHEEAIEDLKQQVGI